jgi:hypothetical protein
MTATIMEEMAFEIAEEAYKENFESRRGVGTFEDEPGIYLWDAHPYAGDPHRREREMSMLESALLKRGIAVEARASYPPEGDESAGYTVAIVFDTSGFSSREERGDAGQYAQVPRTCRRLSRQIPNRYTIDSACHPSRKT